jgi:CBS domain-containing protein
MTPQAMLPAAQPVTFKDGTVLDAMHYGVFAVAPDTPLPVVARLMAGYRIHAIVVWGDDAGSGGTPWGVVSDLDLVEMASAGMIDERTAGDSAVTPAVLIAPTECLARAAQLMCEHRVSHLVVTDPQTGHPTGVLSTLDIVRVLAGERERT